MNTVSGARAMRAPARSEPGTRLQRWARRLLLSRLACLRTGRVAVVEGDRFWSFGEGRLSARIRVRDPGVYTSLAFGGSMGAAESYMDGGWTCDDLTALFRIMVRDRALNEGLESGLARLRAPLERMVHWTRRNSRKGARRNIESHYDLGNDFFSLFLDRTMTYSSAVFPAPEASLLEAQRHKLDLACHFLDLGPQHQVLEIGTGWGGFALHAARRHGCRVVTTTISRRQFEEATRRVRREGLQDRVTVLSRDYRDLVPALRGRFDRVVSIEMIEAVGHRHLDRYFRVCSDLLRPDGAMFLQAILIGDADYERYRRSVDFIQRYIFPGGVLPCAATISRAVARTGDLALAPVRDLTGDYARTLRHWAGRFLGNRGRAREMGLSEPFLRMWEFYLRYCEAGFLERHVGAFQFLITKPGCRLSSSSGGVGAEPCRP